MKRPPRGPGDQKYEVGYGKPPKHTRFQPGRSGNPAGRPKGKGKKNLRSDIEEELRELIQVREGGRFYRVSKQRAMVKALVVRAMKGDPRAVALLQSMRPPDLSAESDEDSTAAIDAAIRAVLEEAEREEE